MKTEEATPRDCFSCRVVGAVGLIGIGGYLANQAFKIKLCLGGSWFLHYPLVSTCASIDIP